jgi:hypothetical protein
MNVLFWGLFHTFIAGIPYVLETDRPCTLKLVVGVWDNVISSNIEVLLCVCHALGHSCPESSLVDGQ